MAHRGRSPTGKTEVIAVCMTPAQVKWLNREAIRQSALRALAAPKITRSDVVRALVAQAMKRKF